MEANTDTRHRIGWTTRDLTIDWAAAGGQSKYTTNIKAGTRVARFDGNNGVSRWTVDEFPLDVFPGSSTIRWDATHYGIDVPRDSIGFERP